MTNRKFCFLVAAVISFNILQASPLLADFFKKEDPIKIEFSPSAAANPGTLIKTQLELYIEHGYHLFSNKPEIKGIRPTTVELEPSKDFQLEKIAYPEPAKFFSEIFQKQLAFYTGKTVIQVYLKVHDHASEKIAITGTVTYQICSNKVCYPPKLQSFSATQAVSER